MLTFDGLPLYRVVLSAEDGVTRVSLVDDPAVDSNFEFFNKEKKAALYAVQDEEKRLVRGVVLRADYPISRKDPDGTAYYVTFGKDVIRQAAERYIADGRAENVDTQHNRQDVDGVQMVQLFIKDSAAGVNPAGFDEIADGSLFAEYHVTNDEIWEEIKAGTYNGFSVEIFYTLEPAQSTYQSQDMKSLIKTLMGQLAAALAAEEPEKFGSVTTDKGVIVWDGNEDLKAGDAVQIEDADGNRSDAADGDYTTGDGKVIVVVEGKVSEIRDNQAEVAEQSPEQMAKAKAEQFAASYEEKYRKIYDAIRAARNNDEEYLYIVSAGDDFAVAAYASEATGWADKHVRYAVSWDGEDPSVSDPIEVRPAFVPVDFEDASLFDGSAKEAEEQMAAAVKTITTMKAENATLKARVAELEKTPAGPTAEEEYKEGKETATGDPLLVALLKKKRK